MRKTPLPRYFIIKSATPSLSGKARLFHPLLNDIGRAAHTGGNRYRCNRTVDGTGAALHTTVTVHNRRLAFVLNKDGMRTDHTARRTADARFLIEFQG